MEEILATIFVIGESMPFSDVSILKFIGICQDLRLTLFAWNVQTTLKLMGMTATGTTEAESSPSISQDQQDGGIKAYN
jgi:hypothetical protein